MADAGAAPHPPAGTFSLYSDGEKEAVTNFAAFSAALAIGQTIGNGVFLPGRNVRQDNEGRRQRFRKCKTQRAP